MLLEYYLNKINFLTLRDTVANIQQFFLAHGLKMVHGGRIAYDSKKQKNNKSLHDFN